MGIKSDIELRNKLVSKFVSLLSNYYYIFIIDLYKYNNEIILNFQKDLYKIPNWSDNHIKYKYKDFNKDFNKEFNKEFKEFNIEFNIEYNNNNSSFTELLEKIIILNVSILSNNNYDTDIKIPEFRFFWYKTLKHIGKFFYQDAKLKNIRNYKNSDSKKIYKNNIESIIENIINTYIPLKDLINTNPNEKITYDFKNNTPTIHISNNISNDISHNISNDNSIKYIDSEEFENEYYHPETIKKIKEDQVKLINFKPKKKVLENNNIIEIKLDV